MTTPSIVRRLLTFHFQRSVQITSTSRSIDSVEVSVIPLSDPSSAIAVATFVGGLQSQIVQLVDEDNPVVFALVPTDVPGLSVRILYRVMWRVGGVTGRTETFDFAMPDEDLGFDQLQELGNVITGAVYLQQSDLSEPGRVAQLNDLGQVVDAFGVPVAGQADVSGIQFALNQEIAARQQAVSAAVSQAENQLEQQINSAITTGQSNLNAVINSYTSADNVERAARMASDATISSAITALNSTVTANAAIEAADEAALITTLASKADLDGTHHVPLAQIPLSAITTPVPVADQAAMLALTTSQVQKGDIAVRPDAAYILGGTGDPSILGNWAGITRVSSVNGHQGIVVLTAADVGAMAPGDSVAQSQVTGLATTFSGKTSTATTTALQTQVNNILADTTYVHTSGGVIPHALNDDSMAYVNNLNQITKKDGTLLSGGAGGGIVSVNGLTGVVVLGAADVGAISTTATNIGQSQITGLATTLSGLVSSSDSRLTNARTPTAHAASHGLGQSDPITIDPSQVTGLPVALANVTALQLLVTGGVGSGYALQSDLTTLSTNVGTLATTVGTKSSQADMTAAQINISALQTGKADLVSGSIPLGQFPSLPQSQITGLSATFAGKADLSGGVLASAQIPTGIPQASISGLSTTFTGKADLVSGTVPLGQLPTNIPASSITGLPAALTTKADLVSGTVPLAQLPNLPQTQITGLGTVLSGKADLTAGVLSAGQIPTGIPQASIAGLSGTLGNKADLVSGTLAVAEIPFQALQHTFVVANRASMLALTTSQVHVNDTCIINATSDQGTYILMTSPPSAFGNWQLASSPIPPVNSVNGQLGTVVLTATDVGALSSGAIIPQSQVSGLVSTLGATATITALTTGLAGKTSQADVQNMLSASVPIKAVANYVALVAVPSLSGQQSVDGVLAALGSIVLLTAQSSSVANGLWVVNAGSWTRATDMATGTYAVKDTLALVSGGSTQANSFWQMVAPSGVVDANAQSWTRVMQAGPPLVYANGNGLNLAGQTFSVKPATGVTVTSAGVGIDSTMIPSKYVGGVPAGLTVATVTHNLNTTSVMVQVIEVSSGSGVLVGWAVTGVNTISLEFSSAPAVGQWRIIVVG